MPFARPGQVAHDTAMHGAGIARAVVLAVDVDGEDGDLALLAGGRSCPAGRLRKGKRKNGAIGLPSAFCTARKPSSISARALRRAQRPADWRATRCACRRCGRGAAYSFTISGSATAMRPTDEEGRLGAVGGKRLEHRHGVGAQRAVVERQHHLAVGQEVLVLVLEAETGARAWCRSRPCARRRAHCPCRRSGCRSPARRPAPAAAATDGQGRRQRLDRPHLPSKSRRPLPFPPTPAGGSARRPRAGASQCGRGNLARKSKGLLCNT